MPPEAPAAPPADLPTIRDEVAGPGALLDAWEILGLVAGILIGIGLLILLGIWLYKMGSRSRKAPVSPVDTVRRRLDDLARRAGELSPNAFSVAVSDALKDYLSQRFSDPVRYETSEEFLQRLSRAEANALPASTRESVAQFLWVSDEIKYGRPPDAEAQKEPLLTQARDVVAGSLASPEASPAAPASRSARRRIVSR